MGEESRGELYLKSVRGKTKERLRAQRTKTVEETNKYIIYI